MTKPRADESTPPPPERRVVMAIIGAPHGVKGEMRAKSFTANPMSLLDYGPFFAPDGCKYRIAGGRPLKDDMLVIRLVGVADRDAAASLTNTHLFIDRAALPAVEDEDEFYHADLIGLDIVGPNGTLHGTVLAILDFGAGDVIELRPTKGSGTWLLPFTKAAVPKVDVAARKITADPAFFMKPEPGQDPERPRPDRAAPGKPAARKPGRKPAPS